MTFNRVRNIAQAAAGAFLGYVTHHIWARMVGGRPD